VSVLEQDFPEAEREIIVVDDVRRSHAGIVKRFEPHARLLRKENGGQASAFNAGIPECRGESSHSWTHDWWAPGKLQAVLARCQRCFGWPVGHGIPRHFPTAVSTLNASRNSQVRIDSDAGPVCFD